MSSAIDKFYYLKKPFKKLTNLQKNSKKNKSTEDLGFFRSDILNGNQSAETRFHGELKTVVTEYFKQIKELTQANDHLRERACQFTTFKTPNLPKKELNACLSLPSNLENIDSCRKINELLNVEFKLNECIDEDNYESFSSLESHAIDNPLYLNISECLSGNFNTAVAEDLEDPFYENLDIANDNIYENVDNINYLYDTVTSPPIPRVPSRRKKKIKEEFSASENECMFDGADNIKINVHEVIEDKISTGGSDTSDLGSSESDETVFVEEGSYSPETTNLNETALKGNEKLMTDIKNLNNNVQNLHTISTELNPADQSNFKFICDKNSLNSATDRKFVDRIEKDVDKKEIFNRKQLKNKLTTINRGLKIYNNASKFNDDLDDIFSGVENENVEAENKHSIVIEVKSSGFIKQDIGSENEQESLKETKTLSSLNADTCDSSEVLSSQNLPEKSNCDTIYNNFSSQQVIEISDDGTWNMKYLDTEMPEPHSIDISTAFDKMVENVELDSVNAKFNETIKIEENNIGLAIMKEYEKELNRKKEQLGLPETSLLEFGDQVEQLEKDRQDLIDEMTVKVKKKDSWIQNCRIPVTNESPNFIRKRSENACTPNITEDYEKCFESSESHKRRNFGDLTSKSDETEDNKLLHENTCNRNANSNIGIKLFEKKDNGNSETQQSKYCSSEQGENKEINNDINYFQLKSNNHEKITTKTVANLEGEFLGKCVSDFQKKRAKCRQRVESRHIDEVNKLHDDVEQNAFFLKFKEIDTSKNNCKKPDDISIFPTSQKLQENTSTVKKGLDNGANNDNCKLDNKHDSAEHVKDNKTGNGEVVAESILSNREATKKYWEKKMLGQDDTGWEPVANVRFTTNGIIPVDSEDNPTAVPPPPEFCATNETIPSPPEISANSIDKQNLEQLDEQNITILERKNVAILNQKNLQNDRPSRQYIYGIEKEFKTKKLTNGSCINGQFENIIEAEIREQQKREEEIKREVDLRNREKTGGASSPASHASDEGFVERPIDLETSSPNPNTYPREKTSMTSQSSLSESYVHTEGFTHAIKGANGEVIIYDAVSAPAALYFSEKCSINGNTSETKIALEIRDLKEREAELRAMREMRERQQRMNALKRNTTSSVRGSTSSHEADEDLDDIERTSSSSRTNSEDQNLASLTTTTDEGNFSECGDILLSDKSSVGSGSRMMSPDPQCEPRHQRKITVKPYEDSQPEETKPVYAQMKSESVIEREIRIAKEREEEFRRDKLLQKTMLEETKNSKQEFENPKQEFKHLKQVPKNSKEELSNLKEVSEILNQESENSSKESKNLNHKTDNVIQNGFPESTQDKSEVIVVAAERITKIENDLKAKETVKNNQKITNNLGDGQKVINNVENGIAITPNVVNGLKRTENGTKLYKNCVDNVDKQISPDVSKSVENAQTNLSSSNLLLTNSNKNSEVKKTTAIVSPNIFEIKLNDKNNDITQNGSVSEPDKNSGLPNGSVSKNVQNSGLANGSISTNGQNSDLSNGSVSKNGQNSGIPNGSVSKNNQNSEAEPVKAFQLYTSKMGVQQRIATTRIQQEIQENTQREQELRCAGKIKTLSRDTVDAKVTRLADYIKSQEPVTLNIPTDSISSLSSTPSPPLSPPVRQNHLVLNGHAPLTKNSSTPPATTNKFIFSPSSQNSGKLSRSFSTNNIIGVGQNNLSLLKPQKGLMQKFIDSRGKLTGCTFISSNQFNRNVTFTANGVPTRPMKVFSKQNSLSSVEEISMAKMYRKKHATAEEKIHEELKDFETREQELRRRRARSLARSQPNLLDLPGDDAATSGNVENENEFDAMTPENYGVDSSSFLHEMNQLKKTLSNPNLLEDDTPTPSPVPSDRGIRRKIALIAQWEGLIQKTAET